VPGHVLAALVRTGRFDVLDPGVVREQLLGNRIVLEGGVSVDAAMALLELLDADFVLSGYVEVYDAPVVGLAAPRVEFTTFVLDRATAELVWSSFSTGAGDDHVFFFEAGRVYTATSLSCRLARGVADALQGGRTPLARAEPHVERRECVPGIGCSERGRRRGGGPGESNSVSRYLPPTASEPATGSSAPGTPEDSRR
jgi:hypothetical protein